MRPRLGARAELKKGAAGMPANGANANSAEVDGPNEPVRTAEAEGTPKETATGAKEGDSAAVGGAKVADAPLTADAIGEAAAAATERDLRGAKEAEATVQGTVAAGESDEVVFPKTAHVAGTAE